MGIVDGIPCTNPSRTLFDLAAVLGQDALDRACDRAEALCLVDIRALDRLARRPARGIRNLRRALDGLGAGGEGTRSELEIKFRALCRQAGLPPPEVNAWIALGGGHALIDFLWRRQRVAVRPMASASTGTGARSRETAAATSSSGSRDGGTPALPGSR